MKQRWILRAAGLCTLLALVLADQNGWASASGRGQDTPKVTTRKDVAYYEGAGADATRHKLDLYLPEGKKIFPMLVFIHGGAWKNGSKDLYGRLANTFVSQGIGVAVANYRLSPAVQHPEHIKDVARSFAWVYKHAGELGVDPKRIFISGHSAGGHLVALLALDPKYLKEQGLGTDSIRGVIGISGPYSLTENMFPDVFGTDAAKRSDAFPLNHLRDQDAKVVPPFLILYADKDYAGLGPVAKLLAEGLAKQGVKNSIVEIADRDHISIVGRLGQADDPTAKQITAFVSP